MTGTAAFKMDETIGGILVMAGGIEPAFKIQDASEDKKRMNIIYFANEID